MELNAEDGTARHLHGAGEGHRMHGLGNGGHARRRHEAVGEVEELAGRDSIEQRIRLGELHGVPSHMGHFVGEAGSVGAGHGVHHALDEAEAAWQRAVSGRVLGARLEHEVHPKADAQKRRAAGHRRAHRLHLAHLLHGRGGIGEGPHAGQHHGVGRADDIRLIGHDDVCPRAYKSPLHREQVSLMVVDNDDAHSTPLVEGTAPPRAGSTATAWRRARPAALKAASKMWCTLSPASCRMCRVMPALAASAMKNSRAS